MAHGKRHDLFLQKANVSRDYSNFLFSFYQVVVYHADERTGETCDARKNVSFHNASVVGKADAYIAAQFPAASVKPSLEFLLGDGRHYGHFTNSKLSRGKKYNVYSRNLTIWNSKVRSK